MILFINAAIEFPFSRKEEMDKHKEKKVEGLEVIRVSKGGEYVKPASTTPTGMLHLSAIDKLGVLRCYARTLHVFKNGGTEAARVIRDALAKALVPYYPLAGRLKFLSSSNDNNNIQVECCGRGVWFIEASAPNCTLESLNYLDDYDHDHGDDDDHNSLLPNNPSVDTQGHLDSPLVLIQVTQFACGGYVMGLTFCHSICDGLGAAQFLQALGELARSAAHLSVAPVWHRDFLPTKRLQQQPPPPPPPPNDDEQLQLQHANIDIPLDLIIHLKHQFQDNNSTGSLSSSSSCSAFEIMTAMLWKHRTLAITNNSSSSSSCNHHQHQEPVMMKLVFFANCRGLVQPDPLPQGFYGNCFFPVTITASRDTLSRASIPQVIKLIQQAKAQLPNEFHKWTKKGTTGQLEEEDPFAPPLDYNTLFISEWGRLGFNQVDYGWGPPVYVVPIQGSPVMPVVIVGSLPLINNGKGGIRLMTWCVHKPHLPPFLHQMASSSSSITTTTTTHCTGTHATTK